jgi:DNA helicase HerA-like ATPase
VADEHHTGELPAGKPQQIAVFGRKGSGKTELAYLLFESFPRDKVGIDPNGDIKFPDDVMDIGKGDEPIPHRWPGELIDKARPFERERKPVTLRYVPDFGAKNSLDQIDRVIGLALSHGGTMLLVDEAHEAVPVNKTPPHARRALRQGRHRRLSSIWVTPRPKTIDVLVISNADWVYIFDLPNPDDRKRVAENIGWDPKDFDAAVFGLSEFEYLRYDAVRKDLAHYPAIPEEHIKGHRTTR